MSTDATNYDGGSTFAMRSHVHSMSSAIVFPRASPLGACFHVDSLGANGDSGTQLSSCPQGFQHAAHLEDAIGKARFVAHVFGDAIE